jgi:nitrogen-specific signal transduction histidine kinase
LPEDIENPIGMPMANDDSTQDARPPLSWDLLDSLLLRAPVDVLLLDRELICRYAAPAEERFLGQPRDALPGKHVAQIFPPAGNGLRPVLERAVRESTPWRQPQYRFTCAIDGADTSFCSAIQVEPIDVADYQGVVLILADARELQGLAETHERLRTEVGRLRSALQEVQTVLRGALAPVSGYLQMIARGHAALATLPAQLLITRRVLPSIDAIVTLVDQAAQSTALVEASAAADNQDARAGERETDTRTRNG